MSREGSQVVTTVGVKGSPMNGKVESATWGKKAPPCGDTPAIALVNPKYPNNVGMVVRLASCYGLRQVWFTGNRVSLNPARGERLPREERMKGYKEVQLIHYDYFFDQFAVDTAPVAVEVRTNSEPLHSFEHPDNALYVFGPEDGSIPKAFLNHCHRFLVIPTRHCLNLATAVATVLWDREYKSWLSGKIDTPVTPGAYEQRGLIEPPESLVFATE
jgi:tRNA(Leu) C34 or U34 (ribose-2'-O)-methylase TrmL